MKKTNIGNIDLFGEKYKFHVYNRTCIVNAKVDDRSPEYENDDPLTYPLRSSSRKYMALGDLRIDLVASINSPDHYFSKILKKKLIKNLVFVIEGPGGLVNDGHREWDCSFDIGHVLTSDDSDGIKVTKVYRVERRLAPGYYTLLENDLFKFDEDYEKATDRIVEAKGFNTKESQSKLKKVFKKVILETKETDAGVYYLIKSR